MQVHGSVPKHLKGIKKYSLKKMCLANGIDNSDVKKCAVTKEKCSECEQSFEFKYELASHMDQVNSIKNPHLYNVIYSSNSNCTFNLS